MAVRTKVHAEILLFRDRCNVYALAGQTEMLVVDGGSRTRATCQLELIPEVSSLAAPDSN
jgi:hypothetical protein